MDLNGFFKDAFVRLLLFAIVAVILIVISIGKVQGYEYTPNFVWGSYSDRSAKIQPNNRDYEILAGIQNKNYIIDGGIERENGGFYRLAKLNIRSNEWRDCVVEGELLLKEAHGIDSQSIKALYHPFRGVYLLEHLYWGLSSNAIRWANTKGLFNLGYRSKNVQFSWETDFHDRIVLSYKCGFDIPAGKKLITQWFRKYERNNDNKFDQNKMVIGWKINE